jgi:ribosomal 50S subunit-recycling heat shock protein
MSTPFIFSIAAACGRLGCRNGSAGTGDTRPVSTKTTPVRLDKFMKVARLSKRRSEAHEALEHGRITKNGKPLKPGYQVQSGDVFEIHYATRFVTVRVRDVPLRVTPAVAPAALYEILETRKDEPSDWT